MPTDGYPATMVRFRIPVVIGLITALLGVGCNGDDGAATTTTTALTAPGATSTTTDGAGTSTTTTLPVGVFSPPEYEIMRRIPNDDGDTLVVLLDPTSYDVLTDIDLQNVVADIVERFPPVLNAFVVDSAEAVDLVLKPEPTAEEQAIIDAHALVTLQEGFRVVFVGPFGDYGELILGS